MQDDTITALPVQPDADYVRNSITDDQETLVADSRAALTPSQLVEQRLVDRLKASPVMISHMQQRMTRGRR